MGAHACAIPSKKLYLKVFACRQRISTSIKRHEEDEPSTVITPQPHRPDRAAQSPFPPVAITRTSATTPRQTAPAALPEPAQAQVPTQRTAGGRAPRSSGMRQISLHDVMWHSTPSSGTRGSQSPPAKRPPRRRFQPPAGMPPPQEHQQALAAGDGDGVHVPPPLPSSGSRSAGSALVPPSRGGAGIAGTGLLGSGSSVPPLSGASAGGAGSAGAPLHGAYASVGYGANAYAPSLDSSSQMPSTGAYGAHPTRLTRHLGLPLQSPDSHAESTTDSTDLRGSERTRQTASAEGTSVGPASAGSAPRAPQPLRPIRSTDQPPSRGVPSPSAAQGMFRPEQGAGASRMFVRHVWYYSRVKCVLGSAKNLICYESG